MLEVVVLVGLLVGDNAVGVLEAEILADWDASVGSVLLFEVVEDPKSLMAVELEIGLVQTVRDAVPKGVLAQGEPYPPMLPERTAPEYKGAAGRPVG